jgi:large subunit ribosomal protein L17
MRHGKKIKKLSRTKSHRKAMLHNMATSLFLHQRIKTTQVKAKALKPLAEKLITWAKEKSVHAHRQVYKVIKDRKAVKKLFGEIAPQLDKRPGGYCRILKLGRRRGDGAALALLELLIERPVSEKGKDKEKSGKVDKKPLPKKDESHLDKEEKEKS